MQHNAPGKLNDVAVRCPSHENMLIHLAAHSAIHGNSRFLWLYDVVRFMKTWRDELNTALVARRATDWGIALAVYRALYAASELFDDQLLAEVCRVALARVPSDLATIGGE